MLIYGTFKGDDNTVACRNPMSRKAQPVLERSLTRRSAGQGDPTGLLAWRGSEKWNLDLSFQTYSFNTRAADLWAKYRFLLCVGHVKWQVSFHELNSRVKICSPSPFLSRFGAVRVSVCRSKTTSHGKLAQTNCFGEPRILPVNTGPDTQKILRSN